MSVIKKKDLKKYKTTDKKPEGIEELVDVDGAPIEGDRVVNNDSEIEVSPQQTSADFADQAIQPNRFFNAYYGTPYSQGQRIYTESEMKMAKMVEDFLSDKTESPEMVKYTAKPDINRNKIPDITELRKINPSAAINAESFVKKILSTNMKPDDMTIVINFILSNMDFSKVPEDYKKILKSKI